MDKFTQTLYEQQVIAAALQWWCSNPKLKTVDDRVLASMCQQYEEYVTRGEV